MKREDDIEIFQLEKEDPAGFSKMVDFLAQRGIDTANFDNVSRKSLDKLFEEVRDFDVVLMYRVSTGQVIRSAITATVLVNVPSERFMLLEIARRYVRANGTIEHDSRTKEYSISETQKRGEGVQEAAMRGLREELGIMVQPHQLTSSLMPVGQDFLAYRSRAYEGLWSYTMIHPFELELPKRPWTEMIEEFPDGDTIVHVKWFAY